MADITVAAPHGRDKAVAYLRKRLRVQTLAVAIYEAKRAGGSASPEREQSLVALEDELVHTMTELRQGSRQFARQAAAAGKGEGA